MIQVTVIIPIHNSEKYLEECMQSVLSQSFQNLEILCIDGGSTDGSGNIIQKLQEKDGRIISIYDRNTSYGHKINIGIEKARGKYFAILESDDRMQIDMIEKLYQIAEKYDTDIADANYYEVLNYHGKELRSMANKYSELEDYNRLIDYNDEIRRPIVTTGIWTGLYKKSFIVQQNIWLNESAGASYQDLSFLFLTSILAGKVYHVNIPLYQYRVDNLESSVKDGSKIYEIIGECAYLKRNLVNRGIQNKSIWKLYYIRKYYAFYWNYCRLSKRIQGDFLKKYAMELKQDMKSAAFAPHMVDSFLYDRTFLLLDNIEDFVKKANRNLSHSFLEAACRGLEKAAGRDVVLFGSGRYGLRLLDILTQNKASVSGICDNSLVQQGTILNGIEVDSVKETVKKYPNSVYFITSNKYAEEMLIQLQEEGIPKENIIVLE